MKPSSRRAALDALGALKSRLQDGKCREVNGCSWNWRPEAVNDMDYGGWLVDLANHKTLLKGGCLCPYAFLEDHQKLFLNILIEVFIAGVVEPAL